MNIKLKDVARWARAAQLIFDANFDGVTAYDPDLAGTWESLTLVPKITAVENMLLTLGLRKLNKQETATRNGFLDGESPLINDLEFAINKCLKAGTITDGVGAFAISALRKSIKDRDINGFHSAFSICIARVNANATPLSDKGFTVAKKNAFKGNHDSAYNMQNNKQALKLEIKDLSSANRIIVNDCIKIVQMMIDSIFAYAKSIGDKDLMKQATANAILKSVVPTPEKKPRNRIIKAGSSIILNTDLVAKNIMQLTLGTDVQVMICRTELKTDSCTAGTVLPFSKMLELKRDDVMGTGRYVKLTNKSTTKKAKVLYFEVVTKKS